MYSASQLQSKYMEPTRSERGDRWGQSDWKPWLNIEPLPSLIPASAAKKKKKTPQPSARSRHIIYPSPEEFALTVLTTHGALLIAHCSLSVV